MSRIKTLEQIQAEEYEARNKEARPFQTAKLLIVYGRQSTITQFINNVESQQEQALDLLDYGARLGWPEELRLLFIENQLADGTIKNASGRLRIDQREGLQAVFALIKAGKVGAVLVSAKEFVASILVSELDQMFEEILLMRLATLPKNAPPPYDLLKAIQATALVSVNEQIAKARIEHARLQREHDVNFDIMSDKELRENKLARNVLLQQIEELEQKVKDADRALEDAQEVQCLLCDAGETWRKKTLEEKRRYIRIITTGIWLNMVAPGWLKMEVYWSPVTGIFNDNECIIWQQNAGKGWSEEENEILRANYGSASRAWLIEHLPYRSWQSIRSQAYRLQVKRGQLREEYAALPDWLCLSDAQVLAEYPFIHLHRDTKQFHLWYTAVTKEHARSGKRGAVPP